MVPVEPTKLGQLAMNLVSSSSMRGTYEHKASDVRPNLMNWETLVELLTGRKGRSCLLLFHELCVRYIVDNVFSEDRSRQNGIYLFGIDVLELAIQDELVTF